MNEKRKKTSKIFQKIQNNEKMRRNLQEMVAKKSKIV